MICRILLLIILTSCVSGSFVVNVTQTSYQAEENHNITLEWTFTTNPDRSTKTLNILCELFISDKSSVLYHVHEGVEVSESQDEEFSGRVQSDKDALREGRIRLQLSRLRTDDSGLYLCEVNTDYGFTSASYKFCITRFLLISAGLALACRRIKKAETAFQIPTRLPAMLIGTMERAVASQNGLIRRSTDKILEKLAAAVSAETLTTSDNISERLTAVVNTHTL
ncbi:uncharacterized protein LOC120433880 [Oreochromis aureus]|uniref:uncharacterized protein LOC120433880 n=1 Tax=Oreochromis aureus TaxID=47969 RepID=UPI00195462E1|nr:uncharacterized protein LOC120433880 [Oreochromis aureus]